MINAFLISGAPRSLVIDEMVVYYKNLIDYYLQQNITLHFYIILKLDENISNYKAPYERFINNNTKLYFNTLKGLNNFNTILNLLNPIKVICFNKFKLTNIILYSQIQCINILINDALEYSKKNNFTYDYFIRSRPDLILLDNPNFNNLNNNIVYTGIKCDSKGSDMFFIFNNKLINTWWNTLITNINKEYYLKKYVCPEYYIFNDITTKQIYKSALVRKHSYIQSWNKLPGEKVIINYINNNNNQEMDYIIIDTIEVVNKLNEILVNNNKQKYVDII